MKRIIIALLCLFVGFSYKAISDPVAASGPQRIADYMVRINTNTLNFSGATNLDVVVGNIDRWCGSNSILVSGEILTNTLANATNVLRTQITNSDIPIAISNFWATANGLTSVVANVNQASNWAWVSNRFIAINFASNPVAITGVEFTVNGTQTNNLYVVGNLLHADLGTDTWNWAKYTASMDLNAGGYALTNISSVRCDELKATYYIDGGGLNAGGTAWLGKMVACDSITGGIYGTYGNLFLGYLAACSGKDLVGNIVAGNNIYGGSWTNSTATLILGDNSQIDLHDSDANIIVNSDGTAVADKAHGSLILGDGIISNKNCIVVGGLGGGQSHGDSSITTIGRIYAADFVGNAPSLTNLTVGITAAVPYRGDWGNIVSNRTASNTLDIASLTGSVGTLQTQIAGPLLWNGLYTAGMTTSALASLSWGIAPLDSRSVLYSDGTWRNVESNINYKGFSAYQAAAETLINPTVDYMWTNLSSANWIVTCSNNGYWSSVAASYMPYVYGKAVANFTANILPLDDGSCAKSYTICWQEILYDPTPDYSRIFGSSVYIANRDASWYLNTTVPLRVLGPHPTNTVIQCLIRLPPLSTSQVSLATASIQWISND